MGEAGNSHGWGAWDAFYIKGLAHFLFGKAGVFVRQLIEVTRRLKYFGFSLSLSIFEKFEILVFPLKKNILWTKRSRLVNKKFFFFRLASHLFFRK